MLLLAQYTEDNRLEFGEFLNTLKRNVDVYSNSINKLKELDTLIIFKDGKIDVEDFTKGQGISDSILIEYTETLKDTDGVIVLTMASTDGLSAYLKKRDNHLILWQLKLHSLTQL